MNSCGCYAHNGFLTRAGYLRSELAAEQYCDEVVDGNGFPLHLDRVGSVSALDEDEDSPACPRDSNAPKELHHGS